MPYRMAVYLSFAVSMMLLIQPALAKSPITIGSGESVRAQVNAELLVQVLVRAGFKARSMAVTEGDRPTALTTGKIHILPEVSAEQVQALFGQHLSAGTVVDLGHKQAGPDDPQYRKLAWSKTRRRWTNEFKLIKNMTIPERDVAAMVSAVQGGQMLAPAVEQWVNNNSKRWGKWKSASKNWMKP